MSAWDDYIKSVMDKSKGQCDAVCLLDKKTGAFWNTPTAAGALQIKATEAATIAKKFASGEKSFAMGGVVATGLKYQFFKGDTEDHYVLAKLKGHGALVIQASKLCLVVARTKEGGQAGDTNSAVANVVSYLIGVNY